MHTVKDVVEVLHSVLIWNWITRDELRVVVCAQASASPLLFTLTVLAGRFRKKLRYKCR